MTRKLHLSAAVAVFATLFYVGCGDDDENVSPSTGGASANGGKTGSGGANNAGTNPGTGGKVGSGGKAGVSGGSANQGGETSTGGVAPSEGGVGGIPLTPEGGSGGAGGAPEMLPPCSSATYDATAECYTGCAPATTATSEQFLNHCSEAGAQCTKFTAPLPKVGATGALPPLP